MAPAWARLLVAGMAAVALALSLMCITAVFATHMPPNWWLVSLLPNIVICMCILYTVLGVLRLAEVLLSPVRLAWLARGGEDWRAGLALSAIVIVGIMIGMTIGFTIGPQLVGSSAGALFISLPAALFKFVLFLFVMGALNWVWWNARVRHQNLRQEAVEAQLRLLQAQIEPHFLFNTLANVQSLMDADPPRARRMLEAFSDYLRAGLGQLRSADSTLDSELAMVRSYLALLQIRMGERLRFSIDATPAARAVRLPALLLQPLVENAIQHGLEPAIDGGTVCIRADVSEGRMQLVVDDDGMGLDSGRRPLRPGNGMAVANLRARLQARYGADAAFTLTSLERGTRARIDLPCGYSA